MIKKLLRVSVWCLFISLALNVLFSQTMARNAIWTTTTTLDKGWLQLNYHEKPGDQGRLWPERTVIITSAKPIVQQLRNDRWQISFKTNQ